VRAGCRPVACRGEGDALDAGVSTVCALPVAFVTLALLSSLVVMAR
jgi:hypothetical protein